MSKPMSQIVKQAVLLAREPGSMVAGDISSCLPSWLKTFSDAFDLDKGVTLSPSGAATLYHTLLCQIKRNEQLIAARELAITERDDAVRLHGMHFYRED